MLDKPTCEEQSNVIQPPQDAWSSLLESLDLTNIDADEWIARMKGATPPTSAGTFLSQYSQDSKHAQVGCNDAMLYTEKCTSPSSVTTSQPSICEVKDTEQMSISRSPFFRVESPVAKPSLVCVFQWVSRADALLLVPALIALVAAGCVPIVMTRVLGSAFGAFVHFDRYAPNSASVLRHKIRTDSAILVGLAVGTILFQFIATVLWRVVAERAVRRMRRRAYASFTHKGVSWYDLGMGISADADVGPGGLMNAFNRDTDDVRMAIGIYVRNLLLHLATMLVGIIFALVTCWDLTLVILASLPLLVCATILTEMFGVPLLARVRQNSTMLASLVETAVSQINTVKVYGAQSQQSALIEAVAARGSQLYVRLSCVWGARLGICSAIGLLAFVQGFGYGYHLVSHGKVSAESVMSTFLATVMAMGQLQTALVVVSQIEKGKVAAAHIDAIINSHVNEPGSASATIRPVGEYRGELILHDVSFAYPARPETLVLDHVSMFFPAGEHTYILGSSGSGKSTVAQLLLGMYKPFSGHIMVDSHNMANVDPRWLGEHISGVSQSSLVLEGSLYDNIAAGAPCSMKPDHVKACVQEACRIMGIDELAQTLPDGIETVVGRRGTGLSGGQRQRLALARARVRDPTVLVLDEATSALDAASAARVHAAVKEWRKNRTTIVITHSIMHVAPDCFCYLLANGRVIDSGFRFVVEQRGRQSALSQMFASARRTENSPTSAPLSASMRHPFSPLTSPTAARSKVQQDTVVQMPEMRKQPGIFSAALFLWRTLPNRLAIMGGIVCCIASGFTTPVFSYFLAQVLVLLQTLQSSRIGAMVGATAAMAVGDGALKFLRFSVMEALSAQWFFAMRCAAFSRVLAQDRTWHDKSENAANRITNAVVKDTEDASALFGYVVGQFVVVAAMVFGTLIYTFIMGWELTLCALALLPFMIAIFVVQGTIAARAERWSKNMREHVGELVYDLASSVRELRAMALVSVLERGFNVATQQAYNAGLRTAFVAGGAAGLGESMTYIAEAVLYAVGGELLVHGIYDLHRFLIVINALVFTVAFATSIAGGIPALSKSVQAMLDVRRLVSLQPDNASDSKGDLRPHIYGGVEFHNVSFSYADGERGIYDVSLTLRCGERVAIAGHSGSGKSTIASLLQRLYEPTSGYITVDGHALSTMSSAHLRAHIAVVGQTPALFPASVAENIRCGRSDAHIPQDAVVTAARRAHAHQFIEALPSGYNTAVGGTTSHLSGGQAQRIAVARALARPARILVLDEFTSSLDRDTADAMIEAVLGVRDDKSVLVITHDTRLMQRCDRVVVLEQGTVVEQGTFDDLVSRGGALSRDLQVV